MNSEEAVFFPAVISGEVSNGRAVCKVRTICGDWLVEGECKGRASRLGVIEITEQRLKCGPWNPNRDEISNPSGLHRRRIWPTSETHLAYIGDASGLHRRRIWPTSETHLAYIGDA
jgi:hypothetical protein